MSSYQLRICYLYGENNNMGCEKIVNKMSGAAMSAGRLGTATVQTHWHDNTGPCGQNNRPAHRESSRCSRLANLGLVGTLFTAEDSLESKWCNDTFLKISLNEETNLILDGLRVSKLLDQCFPNLSCTFCIGPFAPQEPFHSTQTNCGTTHFLACAHRGN